MIAGHSWCKGEDWPAASAADPQSRNGRLETPASLALAYLDRRQPPMTMIARAATNTPSCAAAIASRSTTQRSRNPAASASPAPVDRGCAGSSAPRPSCASCPRTRSGPRHPLSARRPRTARAARRRCDSAPPGRSSCGPPRFGTRLSRRGSPPGTARPRSRAGSRTIPGWPRNRRRATRRSRAMRSRAPGMPKPSRML